MNWIQVVFLIGAACCGLAASNDILEDSLLDVVSVRPWQVTQH